MLENYSKVINIEALTMVDMAKKMIIPAVSKYTKELAKTVQLKTSLGMDAGYEKEVATKLSSLNTASYEKAKALEDEIMKVKGIADAEENAKAYEKYVISAMNELRVVVDEMETMTAKEYWPMPTYGDLLFGVR